jgi:hypothetical protein
MDFKLHVHFFPRQSMYVGGARLHDNSRAAIYDDFCPSPRNGLIAASSRNGKNRALVLEAQTGGIERQRSATESAICLTRFSVPLCRKATARKTSLSMV